ASTGPFFAGTRAGGSLDSPTAVLSGFRLVTFLGQGLDDSLARVSGGEFFARALENWTPTARGTEWVWAAHRVGAVALTNLFSVSSPSANTTDFKSGSNLLRFIPGSTGIVYRDSTNAAD